MPEIDERSEFQNRLRRLPGRLALALVNATAVLLIAAAILVVIALNRIEHAGARVSAAMTDAVLARVELEPARLKRSVQAASSEIHKLQTALEHIKQGGAQRTEQVEEQIATMTEALKGLRDDVRKLTEAKARLTDEAISAIGNSVTDGLLRLRNCGPAEPQRSQ